MPQPVVITIPHQLGKEEATRRLQNGLGRLRTSFGTSVAALDETWSGDHLDFRWGVLGQSVKDSLCGTKMMLRSDYERVLRRIAPFGDFDPFGDFNLLFGSALLNLRIRDVPVRYKDRTYGETNISRFRHGALLFRMTWFGVWKLRFFPQGRRPRA